MTGTEIETANDAVWLLTYYNGSMNKTCIIDKLPIGQIDAFIQHLNDDMEYTVQVMVELHVPSQMDSNNPYAFKVVCENEATSYLDIRNIRELPCYRFVPKDGESGEHLIDHTGEPAQDF